jgi:hypothetical protein
MRGGLLPQAYLQQQSRWLGQRGTTGIPIEIPAGEADYFTHGPVYQFRVFLLPPA